MTLDEYITNLQARIEDAALAALSETTQQTENLVRYRLPSSRVKTRQAVQSQTLNRSRRPITSIGLRFSKRYPIRNTPTSRLFAQTWRTVRPTVLPRFRSVFFRHLKANS